MTVASVVANKKRLTAVVGSWAVLFFCLFYSDLPKTLDILTCF